MQPNIAGSTAAAGTGGTGSNAGSVGGSSAGIGSAGSAAASGAGGPAGPAGPAGSDAPVAGDDGAAGSDGSAGSAGSAGSSGAAGSAGSSGAAGSAGSDNPPVVEGTFSFFVTSVEAMRELSGSPDGFGGDLGGLTGADAICQMIAATEGAGHKTWRAFLSATTGGPNGGVTHAIDRIGEGPCTTDSVGSWP